MSDNLHILMIDDSAQDVLLAKRCFGRSTLPLTLTVATDGATGMAMIRHEGEFADVPRPDVVLLDLHMPKMSGREVLAAIKGDPELKEMPVFVMTTSKAAADIFDLYALGASGYFVKPVMLDEVYQRYFRDALKGSVAATEGHAL